MGRLIPTYWTEVLPGDSFKIRQENIIRFAALVAPVFHDVRIKTYWFAVPYRLLWPNWENFMSPQKPEHNDIVAPTVDVSAFGMLTTSIGHYLGLPAGGQIPQKLSAFPLAAYLKIYNEWFRNQTIQDDSFVELIDGDNPLYAAQHIAPPYYTNWQQDYFTASLPYAQKGDVVTIPLVQGGLDPLVGLSGTNSAALLRRATDGTVPIGAANLEKSHTGVLQTPSDSLFLDPNGTLSVSNFQADAATITALREAFKLQEFLERDAVGGTRYIETLWNHWAVKSSDARLNRPEPIGMFSGNINFSEVLQTGETATTPQGNMAGHGIGINGSGNMTYYAEEHMILMSLSVVKPSTSYHQGIERKWTRETRLDYPWPSFQHIGEQAVLMQEINYAAADPEAEFGYVPRYAEFKYENNTISGEFTTNLNYWTLGRFFDLAGSPPALNSSFIQCIPSDRIFAVEGQVADHIYAMFHHRVDVSRKLAFYGRPMM